MGETIRKRARVKDIGFVGTKYISDVGGVGVDSGLILKQISKVSKVITRQKVTADFIFPVIKPPKPIPIVKEIVEPIPIIKPTPVYEPALYQREELEMLPAFKEAPRLTQKQLQRQRQRALQVQRTIQRQQQKQLQKLVQIPKQVQVPRQLQVQVPAQLQIPKQILGLGLISPAIQKPRIGVRPRPIIPIVPTVPVIDFPFAFRPPRETKAERKRRKRAEAISRKQQLAYQASVGAVTLGITAPRIPRVRLTGLELRPVIRKKKKKKKKVYSNNYINNLNKILR